MQNLLRNSGQIMLLACLSIVLLTGCDQKSKLKLAIEVAGKQCPIDMGAAGEVTSIVFDGTDVVYTMMMNEDLLNLEALDKNPDAMKSAVSAMFRNPQGAIKEMLEMVIQADSGMKFIYKGQTSGKEINCRLGADELKSLLSEDMPQEESDLKKLEEQVNMTNVSCPMAVDESTTLDKLAIEADKVMYYYTIDENSIDMASLKGNEEEMKQNVKSSLNVSEPALKMFLEACLKCNKGLGYHYKGNTSGESVELSFTVPEIKALF